MGIFVKFGEFLGWYPLGTTLEERRLVFKIDWLVLSFSCIAYFTKNLDVSALTNAFVSGMQDDLQLYGNRFNYATSMYYVGYCLFQIPSNIVLTRLPAQYYLPAAEVMWGLFTLGTAFVKTYQQLYVMRFFVGFTATACYVGNAHIVNSWYKRQELGKRNAIYACVWPLGAMFSGYLQSAALSLDGRGGMAGWRWLFVICTIITIPCALIGVFFCPNVPDRCTSRWLTAREKDLACSRLQEDGFGKTRGVDRTLIKRIFGNWRIYVFWLLANMYWMTPYPSGTPFTLWLKADVYPTKSSHDISMVDNVGTVTQAISIVSYLITGFYSDWRQNRWETIAYAGVLLLISNVILLVWDVPMGAKWFAFIANGFANGPTNLVIPWLAETYAHDLEARSAAIAICNVGWVVINLIVPLVAWPTVSAPTYKGGYIWSVIWSIIEMPVLAVPLLLERREIKRGFIYSKQLDSDIMVGREDGVVYSMEDANEKGAEIKVSAFETGALTEAPAEVHLHHHDDTKA